MTTPTTLIIIAGVLLALYLVARNALNNVPEGYEDGNGFHEGHDKVIVSSEQKPPLNLFNGSVNHYLRGTDPVNGINARLGSASYGWIARDNMGKEIGFVTDGTVFDKSEYNYPV